MLGNVFGGFALAEPGDGYIRSPYWLGLRSDTVVALVVFQALAVVGYLMWVPWLFTQGATITDSILDTRLARLGLLTRVPAGVGRRGRTRRTTTCCRPTLPPRAGGGGPALGRRGVRDPAPRGHLRGPRAAHAVVGILLLGSVVVLADGIGWAALAIKRVV